MKTLLLVIGLACLPVYGQLGGGAVYCSNCSSSVQQGAQLAREVATAEQTAQQLQIMILETKNLIEHPSTNITQDIATITGMLNQSAVLAGSVAQVDKYFSQTFGAQYSPGRDFSTQYGQWANTTLNSAAAMARTAAYQGQMLQGESAWNKSVNQMNQSALGRDASLQLGNTIGLQTVNQLQALRSMMMADQAARSAAIAAAQSKDQAGQTAAQVGFTKSNISADGRSW